jgi:thymidine phosphorylase
MRALVASAAQDTLSDEDLADLAIRLADSGSRLPLDAQSADVASTGGISSLSTLVCPLQLRVSGFRVAKVAVTGRPAGGVDVLQTVPNYNARLSRRIAKSALRTYGYIHLLADERWAPLDARLFLYRQAFGGQSVPPLVIASLLAKKLAAGTTGAGLEVRIAEHGNFGANCARARLHAQRYTRVARLLGLVPTCALTDASQPYQPYIGRGEALLALWHVISGAASPWLRDHVEMCARISAAVASRMPSAPYPQRSPTLASAHEALLEAHGANWVGFERRVAQVRDEPRWEVVAPGTGAITYDLDRLRSILVERQHDELLTSHGTPPDPAGVELLVRPGKRVERGAPVLSVRAPAGESRLMERLAGTVRTSFSSKVGNRAVEIV